MFVDSVLLDVVLRGFILAALGMIWVVFLVRIVGLRSFSKMTSFDFVMTIATGSLLAGMSQANDWLGFLQPAIAAASLFLVQWLIARLRKRSDTLEDAIQNEPTILMRNGIIDEAALKRTRVSRDDLIAKLREANVLSFDQVLVVVLETTGDVSVLHGDHLSDDLLYGVRSVG